ncbi:MAG: polysaccharide biosynthesis protein [Fimbriimonadaceae bacterium]
MSNHPKVLEGKKVLVTGGTGSLGRTVVRRMLSGELGRPSQIIVFSRDEAKQHYMRLDFLNNLSATDEVIYKNVEDVLDFRIGDVRDVDSLKRAVRGVEVVFHAAALKQVPSCERFPYEAVRTNITGAQNLVNAIAEEGKNVETVVGISTDKACKPINVMGMTKAVMERILVEANLELEGVTVSCVRYGNVISSRGSVVPLFNAQIRNGGPVTITLESMTRFLLTLDRAVDTVFAALLGAKPGETYVPFVDAANITDLARVMIGGRQVETKVTGIRPGEKVHEIMVSEEERFRTVCRPGYNGNYYVVLPMLPELNPERVDEPVLEGEYSSCQANLTDEQLKELVAPYMGFETEAEFR